MKRSGSIILIGLTLLFLTGITFADTPVMESKIDWFRGIVSLEISSPLPSSSAPLPVVKYQVQRELESQFPRYLRSSLESLVVDSRRTFKEALRDEPRLLSAVTQAGEGVLPARTRLSQDLGSLILTYQFTLFPDIIRPLITREGSDSQPALLGYEPSAPFTGIVIYAAEPLPVYGERDGQGAPLKGSLNPALLPRLFDEEMNPVLTASMMDPLQRETWGVVQYTSDLDQEKHRSRVGSYPLYTMAVGLFGINRTDLILTTETARKLLSREDTRKLLREGRILVIIDDSLQ
jgi:hypothetical protein